jgi:hypothetical protein
MAKLFHPTPNMTTPNTTATNITTPDTATPPPQCDAVMAEKTPDKPTTTKNIEASFNTPPQTSPYGEISWASHLLLLIASLITPVYVWLHAQQVIERQRLICQHPPPYDARNLSHKRHPGQLFYQGPPPLWFKPSWAVTVPTCRPYRGCNPTEHPILVGWPFRVTEAVAYVRKRSGCRYMGYMNPPPPGFSSS